jgi:uncharacterized protein YtpQ (UPF0354 family)
MARRAFRRAVRQEFVAFLSETRPEVQVTAETEDALTLTVEGGHGGTLYLHKFYLAIASVPGTAEARREVFVHFADTLLSERAAESTLSLETHGDRVLPRIVSEAMLSGLPSEVARSPVVGTPLQVVYVLDSEKSVAYLTGAHLADLGLDAAAVHERALHNLRQRFPDGPVRTAVNERSLCVIKSGDSYDAARLLLVPGYLRDGEVLAAGVPDRDTLFLTAPPADGDWSGLQKLARATAGPRLLDRPLRVTRAGFEVV